MSDFADSVDQILKDTQVIVVPVGPCGPRRVVGRIRVSTEGTGGDSGHGLRAALQMRFDRGDVEVQTYADKQGFSLLADGDEELRVLIQMLKLAVAALES